MVFTLHAEWDRSEHLQVYGNAESFSLPPLVRNCSPVPYDLQDLPEYSKELQAALEHLIGYSTRSGFGCGDYPLDFLTGGGGFLRAM